MKESKIVKCLICGQKLDFLWKFENSPIVNNYHTIRYEAKVADSELLFCVNCQNITNKHPFSVSEIFENYAYHSFETKELRPIERYLSNIIGRRNLTSVLEVGCNNGTFLRNLKSKSPHLIRSAGIDRSVGTAKNGDDDIELFPVFFDEKAINDFGLKESFDLTICRHMIAHNPDPLIVAKNIASATKRGGLIYIENASLKATIENSDFSQLYLEHYFALSVYSILKLFEAYSCKCIEVNHFNIHNGSFGVLFKKGPIKKAIINKGANNLPEKYSTSYIRKLLRLWETQCIEFFNSISKDEVYVWGVTAKLVMVLNIFDINTYKGRKIIKGAIDFSQGKIGRYIPGTDILVQSENGYILPKDCTILVGARNFEEEITKKIKSYNQNAKVVIPPF